MNSFQSLRAIVKIYVPLTKNCAQFLKNRTDEQKISRNNGKSHTAEYKYCVHPNTNSHPPVNGLSLYKNSNQSINVSPNV